MKIVLVEIYNGDSTEAEAFKTIDSFREYIEETFDEGAEIFTEQLDEQLNRGYDIVELADDYGVNIKAYTQYPIS